MSYGLQIKNSAGTTLLDTSKQTWNYIGYFIAPIGGGSMSFPSAAGMTVIAQQHLLDDIPMDQKVITHTLSVSSTTVIASGGNRASIVMVLAQ